MLFYYARCLTLLGLITSVWAQSRVSQAVTGYLGNSSALQGQAVRLTPFNLQCISNETHAVITFNITRTPVQRVGYVAFGTGTRMSNSDMFIAWPTIESGTVTWTFSQRTAGGHVMPEANAQQPTNFALLPRLTTLSQGSTSYTLLSILRPLEPTYRTDAESNAIGRATTEIIYAYSQTNPDSTSVNAPLSVHDNAGSVEMSLGTPVRGTVITPSSNTNTTTNSGDTTTSTDDATGSEEVEDVSQPWIKTDDIVVVHALLGSLAWLIVSPSAILLARLGRKYAGWVILHKWLQSGLTVVLTIVSFILGIMATSKYSGLHFKTTHQTLGLVLLLLMLLQVSLGYYIHHLFDAKRLKRPVRNLLHIGLGLTTTCIGFVQIYQGFEIYSDKGRHTPIYIKVIYYIAIAAFCLILLASSIQLAWKRKKQGLPFKDAAFGMGRLTRNNTVATTSLCSIQDPAGSRFSLEERKPQAWQSFEREKF